MGLAAEIDRHQRGLSGGRKSDQADIGDGLELQRKVAGLARLAEQRKSGRLAGARRERGIAQAAAATGGGFKAGARADQVGQQPAVFVEHDSAVGDLDLQVRASGAVAVIAHPLFA